MTAMASDKPSNLPQAPASGGTPGEGSPRTRLAAERQGRWEDPVVDPCKPSGKRVLTDDAAVSAGRDLPAFLARPEGAPVYHGFLLLEESLTDGWRLGAISAFDDDPAGCDFGDAFVVAPDGSRAGLVWAVGNFETHEVCPPTADRWGVYGIAFPRVVRGASDLVECFRAVLPELQAIHARVRGGAG